MCVVGGAVERVVHPAVFRRARLLRIAAHLLSEDVVIGKALGNNRPAHPLAFEIDLGHEIDGALLVDVETRGTACELNGAGLEDDFDCGREKDWIRGTHSAFCRPHSGAAARLTMTTSMPP